MTLSVSPPPPWRSLTTSAFQPAAAALCGSATIRAPDAASSSGVPLDLDEAQHDAPQRDLVAVREGRLGGALAVDEHAVHGAVVEQHRVLAAAHDHRVTA